MNNNEHEQIEAAELEAGESKATTQDELTEASLGGRIDRRKVRVGVVAMKKDLRVTNWISKMAMLCRPILFRMHSRLIK